MRNWVSAAFVVAACLAGVALGKGSSPYEAGEATVQNRVDELAFARLDELRIERARLCSDAVFVRRVYLDVIGTLPTAEEVKAFLEDAATDKRARLIDRLLEREEFADYWAMKWSDVLRVKSEFPINLWPNAVQAYHRWIYASVRDNLPYDRFARQLLTSSGSNFRVAPVNFYRAVQGQQPRTLARAAALTFMGERAENWPAERLDGLAAFFAQVGFKSTREWKEEIVYFDREKPAPGAEGTAAAVFPDGTKAEIAPGTDPREALADWLIRPENPWFARNIVNRIWSWLLGRGIIHEPDDIRADNPPTHPQLLAMLERELVEAGWDLKHIYRLILNSATYQLACVPGDDDPRAESYFAYYPLRRLDAEVLIDALNQITGTTEKYSSAIPEPFTFIPEENRSIALADGSITSSFLEMFGRPSRDTGLDSERNSQVTFAQRMHLLNSSHIQRKILGPGLRPLLQARTPVRQAVTNLYLTILSRYPTKEEIAAAVAYPKEAKLGAREGAMDLAWALINSPEFLYRH